MVRPHDHHHRHVLVAIVVAPLVDPGDAERPERRQNLVIVVEHADAIDRRLGRGDHREANRVLREHGRPLAHLGLDRVAARRRRRVEAAIEHFLHPAASADRVASGHHRFAARGRHSDLPAKGVARTIFVDDAKVEAQGLAGADNAPGHVRHHQRRHAGGGHVLEPPSRLSPDVGRAEDFARGVGQLREDPAGVPRVGAHRRDDRADVLLVHVLRRADVGRDRSEDLAEPGLAELLLQRIVVALVLNVVLEAASPLGGGVAREHLLEVGRILQCAVLADEERRLAPAEVALAALLVRRHEVLPVGPDLVAAGVTAIRLERLDRERDAAIGVKVRHAHRLARVGQVSADGALGPVAAERAAGVVDHQARRVGLAADPADRLLELFELLRRERPVVRRLVQEPPHHDARPVTIAAHEFLGVLPATGNRVLGVLDPADRRFFEQHDAQLVGQVQVHRRRLQVHADKVHPVFLQEHQLFPSGGLRLGQHDVARVDALLQKTAKRDPLAVELEHAVGGGERSDAALDAELVDRLAGERDRGRRGIEERIVGRPEVRPLHFRAEADRARALAEFDGLGEAHARGLVAGARAHRDADVIDAGLAAIDNRHVERDRFQVGLRLHEDIVDERPGLGRHGDRLPDAAKVEIPPGLPRRNVRLAQRRAGAEALDLSRSRRIDHADNEFVTFDLGHARDVELKRRVAALVLADFYAIENHLGVVVDRAELQAQQLIAADQTLRQIERSPIESLAVVEGPGLFPDAGHADLVLLDALAFEAVGPECLVVIEDDIPRSVERHGLAHQENLLPVPPVSCAAQDSPCTAG